MPYSSKPDDSGEGEEGVKVEKMRRGEEEKREEERRRGGEEEQLFGDTF